MSKPDVAMKQAGVLAGAKSIEEEARDILRSAFFTEPVRPRDLGQAIHKRFAALGGVDLPEVPREPSRELLGFEV